jgi:hypothetical protein
LVCHWVGGQESILCLVWGTNKPHGWPILHKWCTYFKSQAQLGHSKEV